MQARMFVNGRVATALVMWLIFLVMTLIALGFPDKARLMPLMIGIPGSILGLAQLLLEIRSAAREPVVVEDAAKLREQRRDEMHMFFWMFLFFAGILCFGFVYAPPLLVAGFLYFGKHESRTTALVSGLATWIVLYGCFELWFRIPLFSGLVEEFFAG